MTDNLNDGPENAGPENDSHNPNRRPNRAGYLILGLGGVVLFLVIAIPLISKFAG